MASNALAYNDQQFSPRGAFNRLAPGAEPPQTVPTAYGVPYGSGLNYPPWLTDLSARGLATDWAPAARVTPEARQFYAREIPPDAPLVFPPRIGTPTTPPALPPAAPDQNIQPALNYESRAVDSNRAGTAPVTVPEGGPGDAGVDGGGGAPADSGGISDTGPPSDGGLGNASDNPNATSDSNNANAENAAPGTGSADNSGAGTDAAGGAAADGNGGAGGSSGAAAGGDTSGSGEFHKGGSVTRNRLMGPDPAGPDDGYAALNIGEGVLTAAAMKHYGPGLLRKLNKLVIPKAAFK